MGILGSVAKRHGYLLGVVSVVVATALFVPGREHFPKGQWPLLYLLVIGSVAGLSGVKPALVSAALAFLCWNFFFLPPYYTFIVHNPQDWLSLVVFLAVAAAIGTQTGRIREREAEAVARGRELAMLNQFSARLVSDASVEDVTGMLVREVIEITGACCAAVFLSDDGEQLRQASVRSAGGEPVGADVVALAGWSHAQARAVGLPEIERRSNPDAEGWPVSVGHTQAGYGADRQDLFLPLLTVGKQEGVLYVGPRADAQPYTVEQARPLVAVANQVAAFLERMRLGGEAVQASALREADRLKSTVMASVSHELKTPLASIAATVTNLAEEDVEWNVAAVRPELASIQEDVGRLTSSINALLDLSRLESAAWEPKKEWFDVADVLLAAVERVPQKQRARVDVSLPGYLPMVCVDLDQIATALSNLLTNALAYSPPGSRVQAGAAVDWESAKIWVEDTGPGIAPEERSKVFDKFYRGKSSAGVASGTGLGLAVAREIVRYHGGRIWLEDVSPHGCRFVISLPLGQEPASE